MPKRPGVEAAIRLAKSKNVALWEAVECQFDEVLKYIGNDLSVHQGAAEKLGHDLRKLKKNQVTKQELLDVIVPWKFSVGKPRHALMKLLRGNQESDVVRCSKVGISHARDIQQGSCLKEESIKKALTAIVVLNGVGPATASVILSLAQPAIFSYMYDEVIDCFCPKRTYTMPVYLKCNAECFKIAQILGENWTPARVARVLWIAARVCAYDFKDHTLMEDPKGVGGKKRTQAKAKGSASGEKSRSKRQRR